MVATQIFLVFSPRYLGKIPILTSIFFRWVETTNHCTYEFIVFFKMNFPTPSRPFQSLTHRWILNNKELTKAETGRPDPHFWTLLKWFGQRHQPTALAADKQGKKRNTKDPPVGCPGQDFAWVGRPAFLWNHLFWFFLPFFGGGKGGRFVYWFTVLYYLYFPIWRAAAYVSNEFKPRFFSLLILFLGWEALFSSCIGSLDWCPPLVYCKGELWRQTCFAV